jgi:hypothetical protein
MRSANIVNKNSILIDLSESDKTKFGKQAFATQSTPQQVFSSIWAVESEVNNGGFSQYFLNSSCETAAFVAVALDTIGAPRTADICRRAIATAFPMGLPPTPDAISAMLSKDLAHCNTERPHSALGYRPPAPQAILPKQPGHGDMENAPRFPLTFHSL